VEEAKAGKVKELRIKKQRKKHEKGEAYGREKLLNQQATVTSVGPGHRGQSIKGKGGIGPIGGTNNSR